MPTLDPRVDAYIAKSALFARPILVQLRALVHEGCPQTVETIKWGAPHFDFEGPMAMMAAFKAHACFGFWKQKLVMTSEREMDAMGQFGKLVTVADLPADREIVAWVKKAAALNASGVKLPTPKKHPKPPIALPEELAAAFRLKKHAKAKTTFEGFSPSHRREYLEWIVEAKGEATRAKRVATTLEWLAEGKSRNWKYQRKGPVRAKGAKS